MHLNVFLSVFAALICTPHFIRGQGQYYNYNKNPYWRGQEYLSPAPVINLKCARLFDSQNFQGRSVDFGANDRKSDAASFWYFTPQSIKVKHGCALTLYGYYGKKERYESDNQLLWGWNYGDPLAAGCCECDSCEGESAHSNLQCARLYELDRCNGCDGIRLNLKSGDKVKSLGPLDNLMSSVVVRPGCRLITYFDPNFQGFRVNLTTSFNQLGVNWNKHISSMECDCPTNPGRPVITLPTVPTTRPQMTLPTAPNWITAPRIPTPSTTKRVITLPTVPPQKPTIATTSKTITTTEDDYDDMWGNLKMEETTTTPKPTTQRTTTPEEDNGFGFESSEEETTPKPTTTTQRTTTPEEDNGFGFESSEEETTPKQTTTTQRTTTPEEDNGFNFESSEEETTTPKTTTTTQSTTTPEEDDDFFGSSDASDEDDSEDEDDENDTDNGFDPDGFENDSEEEETTTINTPTTTVETTTSMWGDFDDDW